MRMWELLLCFSSKNGYKILVFPISFSIIFISMPSPIGVAVLLCIGEYKKWFISCYISFFSVSSGDGVDPFLISQIAFSTL